jgi:hypothetical protein
MSEENSLDLFLNSETPEVVTAEVAPTVVQTTPIEAVVEQPAVVVEAAKGGESASPARERDEGGRFVKKPDEDHMVPLSALLSERERRQAAEAKLPKEPQPDIWEDPKAYIKSELDSREDELLAKAEMKARETFFRYTEGAARSRHTDYDQVRVAFAEEAQKNPSIATQLREAPDPGEFIYRQGKTVLELREVGGDLGAYRQRIETEIRQKVEKEVAERLARTSNIPQSLNTEPSKGAGVTGSAWAGPTPLEEILPNRGRDT